MKNTLYLVEPKYRYAVGVNASVRYRALHFIQRQPGDSQAGICFLDESIPPGNWQQAIFVRPYYSAGLVDTFRQLKSRNTRCIADYDDLLFAPELAESLPATINQISTLNAVRKDCDGYLKALKLFDEVTVSTDHLCHWAAKLHRRARITVKKNQLPIHFTSDHNPATVDTDQRHELHYFSGTKSHQQDLELILPALKKWLKGDGKRHLVLRGSIHKPSDLAGLSVSIAPHCHYLAMGRVLSKAIACVAPLIDNEFNQCKSAIKFLESAQHGVPVVASPVGEYRDILVGGPILADDTETWVQQLEHLSVNDKSWHATSDSQYLGAKNYDAQSIPTRAIA